MRSTQLSSDLVVFNSEVWETTSIAMRSGEFTLLVDSPVLPSELSGIPELLAERGFPTGKLRLFTTHADWDHTLGPLVFPEAPLLCGASSAERLARDPSELETSMAAFDESMYIERAAPTVNNLEPLGVPGSLTLGDLNIELSQADGHTSDGTALLLRSSRVLIVGDYLSPVGLQWVQGALGGSLGAVLDTLDRLEALLPHADIVIPGHGRPMKREVAELVLAEDRAYLKRLQTEGADASLPASRDNSEQRRAHRELNVPAARRAAEATH